MEDLNCQENFVNLCSSKFRGSKKEFYMNAQKIKYNDLSICAKEDHWQLGDEMGEKSSNGTVRPAICIRTDERKTDEGPYIFKIVRLLPEGEKSGIKGTTVKDFYREIDTQNRVNRLYPSITSKIYQVFVDERERIGMFVMDRYTITVAKFIILELERSKPREDLIRMMFRRCLDINRTLQREMNLQHRDPHIDNFMLDSLEDEDIRNENNIKIIDFGMSGPGGVENHQNMLDAQGISGDLAKINNLFKGRHIKLLTDLAGMGKKYGIDILSYFLESIEVARRRAEDPEEQIEEALQNLSKTKDKRNKLYYIYSDIDEKLDAIKDGNAGDEDRLDVTILMADILPYEDDIRSIEENGGRTSIFDRYKRLIL
jgi:serine/threonine protein kinase